uniref:Uncharacterized protein n=1 Tax=Acrobeloides nanus TaxID=290746 RepID=A0A914ELR4_9BILA
MEWMCNVFSKPFPDEQLREVFINGRVKRQWHYGWHWHEPHYHYYPHHHYHHHHSYSHSHEHWHHGRR